MLFLLSQVTQTHFNCQNTLSTGRANVFKKKDWVFNIPTLMIFLSSAGFSVFSEN